MSDDARDAMARGAPKAALRVDALTTDLVRILPGEFIMGSPATEEQRALNEVPTRRVRISKSFYLGRFATTRAQFNAVMGWVPGKADDDRLPVCQISFADALEFCRRASAASQVEIRLPTEAEWEYACRAGTQTRYSSGSTEADLAIAAWYSANSEMRAHPVGQRKPNAWGLYDMHGNVWEFCIDWIEDYATMPRTDPVGRITLHHGAMRGGGWMHGSAECRCATRLISDDMFGGVGFRIAVDSPR
jgi:formylglycine-generating enzyme required for sulfatase activity